MYKYNDKDVFRIYRGGSLLYDLFTETINTLYKNNEQGFCYDPNDLTDEKINWRKNQLLRTDDFTYGASGKYTADKEADGWALTAIAQDTVGYFLLGNQYPIGTSSVSHGAGTIVRSIEVKKGTGVFRFGGATNGTSLFVDVATMTPALAPPTGLPYTITAVGSDWYRLETFSYGTSFASIALSNYIGWSTARAVNSTLDTTNQVGSVIRVRNPSYAFVPYETTESIPYQAISDFNSDFIRAFPSHTLYQDAAGFVPVTAAGQPVGLVLDKSKPITNIPILDGAFLLADGWLSSNPEISVTNVGGSLRVSKGASELKSTYKPFSCESGKLYRLTVKYKNHTGNNVRFHLRNANGSGVNPVLAQSIQTFAATDGEGSSFFISNADEHSVVIDSQNALESSVDVESIVITKVSDSIDHAYQTTSAARPLLIQKPILGSDIVQGREWEGSSPNNLTEKLADGRYRLTTKSSTASRMGMSLPLEAGRTYSIEIDVEATGLPVVIRTFTSNYSEIGSVVIASVPANTRIILKSTFTATDVSSHVGASMSSNTIDTSFILGSVSVKEITGYRTDQNRIEYDGVDDKLVINLPAPLTNATVLRAIPNVGTQVKYNQTLPTLYEDSTNHAGLIAIDRTLTRQEQLRLMTELDRKAGATSLETLTFKVFDNNQEGFVYDPNDLGTLYQDVAGTVPVTEAGQPVGLMLDKSKGFTLGSELFVNPTMSGQWVSMGGGVYECIDSIGTSDLTINTGIVGKFYVIEFEILFNSYAVTTYPFVGAPTSIVTTGVFKYTQLATTSQLMLRVSAGRSARIRLITAKEIAGNHAYQSASASRPILRKNAATGANYLEFDGVDDHLTLGPISLPIPFSHVMALEDRKLVNTQALFSGGETGYLMFTGSSNLGVQQNAGNPSMSTLRGTKEVVTHIANSAEVTLKSNLSSTTRSDIAHKNPYTRTMQKCIGAFTDTQLSTAARIDYYGSVFISKNINSAEEEEIRAQFNKRIGV